jgi:hypothetical protein
MAHLLSLLSIETQLFSRIMHKSPTLFFSWKSNPFFCANCELFGFVTIKMNEEELNWKAIIEYFETQCEKHGEHWLWPDNVASMRGKIEWSKINEKLRVRLEAHVWLYMGTKEMVIPQTHRLQKVCDHATCIRHYVCLPKKQNPPEEMEDEEYAAAERRFQSYCGPKDANGCISWTGGTKCGYGCTSFVRRTRGAHDVAWMLKYRQSIPKGYCIRHLCPVRNLLCVNHEHLAIGTHKDNMNDKNLSGTMKRGQDVKVAAITNATAILIIKSYGQGTVKERANQFHVTERVIRDIDSARCWTWLMNEDQIRERRSKIRHVKSLSRELVREIKASKGQGTQSQRAIRFDVRLTIVCDIDNGKHHASVCLDEEEDRIQIAKEEKAKRSVKIANGRKRIEEGTTRFTDDSGNQHWLWKGNQEVDGNATRGRMHYFRKTMMVHTVAFLAFNDKESLPKGMVMRHLCRYAHCCNPDHLCPGTPKENSEDMKRDGTVLIGAKNPNCVLRPEIVCKIKATTGLGTITERAKAFGVTKSQVHAIDAGKIWAHLVDLGVEPSQETLDTLQAVTKASGKKQVPKHQHKMSIETVRKIKATKEIGTRKERAKAFSVTLDQVRKIDIGETWRNVTDLQDEPSEETMNILKAVQNEHKQKRKTNLEVVQENKRRRTN